VGCLTYRIASLSNARMQCERYGSSMLTLLRRTDLAVIRREDVLLPVIN
jgi:hypothetical protein